MKKAITLIRRSLCLMAAAALAFPSVAVRAEAGHPVYKITFAGRGESKTVDEVLVENLSNGQSASLRGQDTLLLKAKGDLTAIGSLHSGTAGDLRIADGRVQLALPQPSSVQIAVYTMDGRLAWQTRMQASSRSASVALPPLAKGVYVVRATAPGLEQSVKWAGGSALTLAAGHTWDAAAAEEQPQAVGLMQPLFAADAEGQARGVEMEFALGDMLRLTGTSGQMRTITMNSPRSSHPIHFDFFRCEDSDGYNYTIVRVGDQLWMAEDLHAKQVEGVTRIESVQKWQREPAGYPSWMLVLADDNVYYTKTAAELALPKGWSLPTQGEVDYLVQKLGGYSQAGRALKSRGTEWPTRETSLDASSAGFVPHGDLYSGTLNATDQARYVLRSTHNLLPTSLVLEDGKDGVSVMHHVCRSVGFHVRGMRSAPSAYTEMMEHFGFTEKSAVKRKAAGQYESGPLGRHYTMFTGGQSIAYDFTGRQLNANWDEMRSGLLYKESGSLNWTWDSRRGTSFLSGNYTGGDECHTIMRKMTPMTNSKGTQYIVEAQWERPSRLWTEKTNGVWPRTDSPDIFGEGRVIVRIMGDKSDGHGNKIWSKNKDRSVLYLSQKMRLRALDQNTLPYFLWERNGRPTETRLDYVQRVFQILNADVDQDGVDDLIVHMDGQIAIYSGADLLSVGTRGTYTTTYGPIFFADLTTGYSCTKYYLKRVMTRVTLGDVNGDGKQDLVVLHVGSGATQNKSAAIIKVYSGCNISQKPMIETEIASDWTNAVFNDIKVGNVTGGPYPDIVVTKRDYSGTALARSTQLFGFQYDPSLTYSKLRTLDFGQGNGTNVNYGFPYYDGNMGNSNLTLAYFRGREKTCDIVNGTDIWRYDPEQGRVRFYFQVLPFVCEGKIWSILADNIIAADPEGTGRDKLYYFRTWSTWNDANQRVMLASLCETYFDRNQEPSPSTLKHNFSFNSSIFKYCDNGPKWGGDQSECELMWWWGRRDRDNNVELSSTPALCAVYDREGVKRLKYKSHSKAFSEPRIHALLAAPPVYDYSNGVEPNYDYVTSWGRTKSSNMQTSQNSSLSSSIIAGFEFEINAPITGTKLGGMDFTTAITQECSKGSSKGSGISHSQIYEARDDDRVVLQVTPYDYYTYEVTMASNPDEIGGQVNIAIPGKPMTIGLALTDYDRLMADAPGTPNLHEVFDHQIGDPFSYPTCPDDITRKAGKVEILWGENRWDDWMPIGSGGSVIRDITLTESMAKRASFSYSMETELVVSAGCAKAGVGFGYNNTNETTHEETTNFSVSGCVPGLAPGDNNPNRPYFQWNLCWYNYTLAGQTFPVVNYIVKPRSTRSTAPKGI